MKSSKLLLTVNVVTYNHALYISQCLDSLLAQKTDFDFVIRIFDDCSTDGTTEICRQYEQDNPGKIEFYPTEKNLGVTENPKRSYKDIKTKYYMYIEGDDFCCNEYKVQKQIETLESHPDCIFCAHKTQQYLNSGEIVGKYPMLEEGVYTSEDVIDAKILYVMSLSSRIVRTKAIPNKDYDLNYYILDSTQMYMLFERGNLYFIDEVMTAYRMHTSSFWTGQNIENRFNFVFKNFMICNEYLNKKYEKNIFKHIITDLSIAYEQKYVPEVIEKLTNSYSLQHKLPIKSIIKKIKHYILPPFIIDILNIPRNIIRFAKAKRKSKNVII